MRFRWLNLNLWQIFKEHTCLLRKTRVRYGYHKLRWEWKAQVKHKGRRWRSVNPNSPCKHHTTHQETSQSKSIVSVITSRLPLQNNTQFLGPSFASEWEQEEDKTRTKETDRQLASSCKAINAKVPPRYSMQYLVGKLTGAGVAAWTTWKLRGEQVGAISSSCAPRPAGRRPQLWRVDTPNPFNAFRLLGRLSSFFFVFLCFLSSHNVPTLGVAKLLWNVYWFIKFGMPKG